jgi:hypothetical protein
MCLYFKMEMISLNKHEKSRRKNTFLFCLTMIKFLRKVAHIFKIIKKFTIKIRIQLVEGNLYSGGGYSLYKWKNDTDEKTFHANSI